jgi:hypothetical protein
MSTSIHMRALLVAEPASNVAMSVEMTNWRIAKLS